MSDPCPHCGETGFLIPEDEWVVPEERTDNRQAIYSVMQELNDDIPELENNETVC